MSKHKEIPVSKKPPISFILPLWAATFHVLSFVSVFSLLRLLIPWLRDERISYAVVEIWVIGHTLLAFVITLFVYNNSLDGFMKIIMIYGGLRVLELVVYHINNLIFDEWRARRAGKPSSLRGYRRLFLLLLHNYIELIFWLMVALIFFQSQNYIVLDDSSYIGILHESLLSIATFSSESIQIIDWRGQYLLTIVSLIGMFMTMMVLARILSLIPIPTTLEPTEP